MNSSTILSRLFAVAGILGAVGCTTHAAAKPVKRRLFIPARAATVIGLNADPDR